MLVTKIDEKLLNQQPLMYGAPDRSRTCMCPVTFHLVRSQGGYRRVGHDDDGNSTRYHRVITSLFALTRPEEYSDGS